MADDAWEHLAERTVDGLRHRAGTAFDQQSQRYVSFKKRDNYTIPDTIANGDLPDDLAGRFQRAIDDNLELYGQLLQAEVPAEVAARKMLGNAVLEALDELNDREKEVIRLRFGLDDGQPRTLEEVGREFGVTRERIRQIESKTLAKLRHPHRSQKLRDYLEGE